MAKITYIRHSCFLLEFPEANFIFDYWRDPSASGSKSRGEIPEFIRRLPEEKPLYLLVSHGHKDHYNPEIFGWAEHFADARFIVSNDVWKRCRHIASPTSVYHGPRVDPERLVRLLPGERFSQGDISISAFPSTDIGNSYMVIAGGKRIFHAGDLNAWILEEKTPSEKAQEISNFKSILSHIAKTSETIDLAMFPIDSRIGSDYTMGADIFLNRFDIRHLIPMHFANCDQSLRQKRIDDVIAYKNTISLLNPNTEFHALTNPYTGIEL